eukprot:8032243-Pyramimonas_sp.AAC.1
MAANMAEEEEDIHSNSGRLSRSPAQRGMCASLRRRATTSKTLQHIREYMLRAITTTPIPNNEEH